MSDLKCSWKNNKNVAQKQLKLNLNELSSKDSYPAHWNACLHLIKHFGPKKILDLGCGVGTMYRVITEAIPNIDYTGVDFSEESIKLAKETWGHGKFYVKDVMSLIQSDISEYDLVFTSALFDVMPNGDDALEHILRLQPKSLLISRAKITLDKSFYRTYMAYDEIETCEFYHNKDNFLSLCSEYNYEINQINDNFYLVRVNDKSV
tara:strand:- start:6958 stop:7575 length:618 start_codon:yes stop_codon:yes gene_type:complete